MAAQHWSTQLMSLSCQQLSQKFPRHHATSPIHVTMPTQLTISSPKHYHFYCHVNNLVSFATSASMSVPIQCTWHSLVRQCGTLVLPHGTSAQHCFHCFTKTPEGHNFLIWCLFEVIQAFLEIAQWVLCHEVIFINILNNKKWSFFKILQQLYLKNHQIIRNMFLNYSNQISNE